ncbi:hypothetical protein AAC387_Pa03g1960 [Persea americana]
MASFSVTRTTLLGLKASVMACEQSHGHAFWIDISLYLAQLHLRVQEIFCEGKVQPGGAKIMLRYITRDGDKWGGLLIGRLDCIVL